MKENVVAQEDIEEEAPRKLRWGLLAGLIVGMLLLVGGGVAGTLWLTGFFAPKPDAAAEAEFDAAAEQAGKTAGGKAGADTGAAASGGPSAGAGDGEKSSGKAVPDSPKRVARASPEMARYEFRYLELERPLLANITGSRKVMQVQIAVMTRYDDKVFERVKKHEIALRSSALDIMRVATEADIAKPDFRKGLAERLRADFNAVLEKLEDFGGIEEVYFTSFVVQ
jgi:flagellar FliL protein